ncbi:MAG: hypothetical protein AVDCRST_MAG68-3173 [uncultured Gemmatimonadetes bacterium]|uniref:Uncharacterized protein n=1 Tax=uncultured Gemmatimonadota bacterium TaxID=203437 RepID=A0A6J4M161_9BACT|nr:MAG: hypothetical protein AVDCRST_MAG68-3173 [uncultured Gemmatimonadota bacterium]
MASPQSTRDACPCEKRREKCLPGTRRRRGNGVTSPLCLCASV